MRGEFAEGAREEGRRGISIILIAIMVVVVVLVAGIAVYVAISTSPSSTISSSTQTAVSSLTTTRLTSSRSVTASSSPALSGTSSYSGTFNFSLALGPSGERVSSNNNVETYSSIEAASGSFVFSISAINESGSGSGHGTLTVNTTGFCSGTATVPYTFEVTDATMLLGNLTLFIGTPTPSSYMVPLTCSGSLTGVNTETNNPGTFIAVYPNELSAASLPASVTMHLSGGINYSYSIAQTR